jgi:hypothetical protein
MPVLLSVPLFAPAFAPTFASFPAFAPNLTAPLAARSPVVFAILISPFTRKRNAGNL